MPFYHIPFCFRQIGVGMRRIGKGAARMHESVNKTADVLGVTLIVPII